MDQKEVNLDVFIKSPWRKRPADNLVELESAHHVLDMYIWLSFRFDEFVDRAHAYSLKNTISDLIETALQSSSPAKSITPHDYYDEFFEEHKGKQRGRRNGQKQTRRDKKFAKQKEARRLRRNAKQIIRHAFL